MGGEKKKVTVKCRILSLALTFTVWRDLREETRCKTNV